MRIAPNGPHSLLYVNILFLDGTPVNIEMTEETPEKDSRQNVRLETNDIEGG